MSSRIERLERELEEERRRELERVRRGELRACESGNCKNFAKYGDYCSRCVHIETPEEASVCSGYLCKNIVYGRSTICFDCNDL